MSDKKEKTIDDELLDQVSGGEVDRSKYLPRTHGPRIYQDQAKYHIGEYVYIVDDYDRENYAWGSLDNVTDDDGQIAHWINVREIHSNRSFFCQDFYLWKTHPYRASFFTLYEKPDGDKSIF